MIPAALVHPVLVFGLGAVVILIVSGHLIAIQSAPMDRRRRQIRTTNGVLMLVTTPLLAFAFGYASPDQPRLFLFLWMAVIALLVLIVCVGLLDLAWTARLMGLEARAGRRALADALRRRAQAKPDPRAESTDEP